MKEDQGAIKESLDLMVKKDPGVPQGFKEIWACKDLPAKQGPEVKLVREGLEAIKEQRVQRDLLDQRVKWDLLDLRAKKDPWAPQGFKEV